MAYRALVTFTGRLSMVKGEVREIEDTELAKRFISAGYLTEVETKEKAPKGRPPKKKEA